MRWRRRQRRRRRRGGGGREGRSRQAGRQRQARGPERTADTTKEEGRRRAVSPRPHPDFRDFPLTLMISLTCRAGSVWSVGCRGRATTTRGREREGRCVMSLRRQSTNGGGDAHDGRKEGRTAPGSFPEGGREGAAAGRGCAGVRTILRRHSSPPVPSLLLPPCCLLAAAAIMPLRKSNNRVATTQTYNNTMPGRGGSQAGRREGRIGTGFPRSVALSWHGASP